MAYRWCYRRARRNYSSHHLFEACQASLGSTWVNFLLSAAGYPLSRPVASFELVKWCAGKLSYYWRHSRPPKSREITSLTLSSIAISSCLRSLARLDLIDSKADLVSLKYCDGYQPRLCGSKLVSTHWCLESYHRFDMIDFQWHWSFWCLQLLSELP